jgi:hydrogenase maturation protease
MAEMLGDYPRHLLLVGVQPVELEDFGGSLREAVRAQIEPAIEMALAYLAELGIQAERRQEPLPVDALQQGSISDIQRYEADRPSEQLACRQGDARILQSGDFRPVYRPVQLEGASVSVDVDAHLEKYRRGDAG